MHHGCTCDWNLYCFMFNTAITNPARGLTTASGAQQPQVAKKTKSFSRTLAQAASAREVRKVAQGSQRKPFLLTLNHKTHEIKKTPGTPLRFEGEGSGVRQISWFI
jgi:hypothetical protein